MMEYYEFAKSLRNIARRADTFGHDRQRVLEELIFAAENYEKVADHLEKQMIEEAA
jgi:Na+/phosphate symporter